MKSSRRTVEMALGRIAWAGCAMVLAGAGGLVAGDLGALWAVAAGIVLLWAASMDIEAPARPRKRMSHFGMASRLQVGSRRATGPSTSS